jgi:hypothetical protein
MVRNNEIDTNPFVLSDIASKILIEKKLYNKSAMLI